jgi:hypothetical protein
MRITVRFAAILALLALPQLAAAGPIEWGYRAVDDNGTVVSQQTRLTEATWSDYFMLDPREHGVYVPDPYPDNELKTDTWRYRATVHITDLPSGETWDVVLYRDYRMQYEWRNGAWDPYYEGETGGPWPGVETTLGDNTYRVSGPGGELLVTVTPNPTAATPEPGTLALAGLGLAGAGLAGRFRPRARAA